MGRVRVVSDTTHYMPREVMQRLGVEQVALYVNWDGRTDRESDLPDFDAFYRYLSSSPQLPTTSQPSVGDFLTVYEPIIERGDDIVSIHIPSGVSGTVRAAEQARDQLIERGVDPGRVNVVDAVTAAGGMGMIVVAAAEAAAGGADAATVVARTEAVRDVTKIWFAVDTLEFLRRGGRIGAAQAWVGSTLRIKPILTCHREITPIERVRTAGRAFDRLVDYLRERRADGCDHFLVQHIQDPAGAERLVDAGREIFGNEPMVVSEVGPVIGTHVGPGLLGVAGTRFGDPAA